MYRALSLVALLGVTPAIAQEIPVEMVNATIDLSGTELGTENAMADAFYAILESSDGLIIWLDLNVIPAQTDGPGYNLKRMGDETDITCGDGLFGTLDNLQSKHSLTFQHPDHFHAPMTIYIGDRLGYPRHDITCGANTDQAFTTLHLNGHFVVEVAEVPTALAFTLFPYNP